MSEAAVEETATKVEATNDNKVRKNDQWKFLYKYFQQLCGLIWFLYSVFFCLSEFKDWE